MNPTLQANAQETTAPAKTPDFPLLSDFELDFVGGGNSADDWGISPVAGPSHP